MTSSSTAETINIADIVCDDRVREDMGDIDALAKSIKTYGIIQPLVLSKREASIVLVAGGRRLAALKALHYTHVVHGLGFVWRDEDSGQNGQLRLQAVELEENLRRKDLHWSEALSAKLKLLRLMESIHGIGGKGRASGFTQRTLASMLNENESVTSRDLELAGYVEKFPALAKLPSKSDAQRRLGVAVTVAAMQSMAKKSGGASLGRQVEPPVEGDVVAEANAACHGTTQTTSPSPVSSIQASLPSSSPKEWLLYEGRFQDNISLVPADSVDLVLTDLPYNIGLGDSTASHSAGLSSFADSDLDISELCASVAVESWRVLRDNRFAVFFYGMNYHKELKDALETIGFIVDPYPFIWLRDRTAPPDGFARYSKTFDPAFIVSKGKPRFIRPNQGNSIAIPSVRGPERLHAAQKPFALMEKFILDTTTPGCVILDLFAGSGTTGEAALKNNRKTILFEIEPSSCAIIKARLSICKGFGTK